MADKHPAQKIQGVQNIQNGMTAPHETRTDREKYDPDSKNPKLDLKEYKSRIEQLKEQTKAMISTHQQYVAENMKSWMAAQKSVTSGYTRQGNRNINRYNRLYKFGHLQDRQKSMQALPVYINQYWPQSGTEETQKLIPFLQMEIDGYNQQTRAQNR